MKIKFLLFVLAILSFFLNELNFAQDIDSLINEAIRHNPQLKSLETRVASAEYRTQAASVLPPPTLGIEFSQIPMNEFNLWDKAISNSLSLSQMFHLGGKLGAMTAVEQQNVSIARISVEIYRVNLIAQLKMSYYNLWLIDRKIEVEQKNIGLLNDLLTSVNVSFQMNQMNQADLLTLKSEIASNKTQLVVLQNQREAEIYKLNKLLGRDLNSREVTVLKNISGDTLTHSQVELEEKLSKINPELLKMNSMIGMNKAMLKSNSKELIPDLMLQAMIMRMPRGMILTTKSEHSMLEAKTETMYGLMADITLPFMPWSAKKFKARQEEYLAEIKNIEYEKTDMQREMIVRLNEALIKLKTARELEQLYEAQVIPLYRQAIEAQVVTYQNNLTNMNTVIDSYQMLLMQEMNYYMAQADYQMAKAEIEMMVGGAL
jgi:outer membrane protein TolC